MPMLSVNMIHVYTYMYLLAVHGPVEGGGASRPPLVGGGGGGGGLPWVLAVAEQLLHADLETEGV